MRKNQKMEKSFWKKWKWKMEIFKGNYGSTSLGWLSLEVNSGERLDLGVGQGDCLLDTTSRNDI